MPKKNDDNLSNYPNIKATENDSFDRRRSYSDTGLSSSKNYLLYFFLFIVISLTIYNFQNLQKMLERVQIYESRIELLEDRLISAGDEMSQSDEAVRLRLKELDSEVRKLWDNVWKKSKAQLATHSTNIKNLTTRSSSLQKNQSRLKNQQLELKSDLMRYNSTLDEIVELVESLEIDNKQFSSLDKQLPNLKDLVDSHDKRIKSNEEWIESINMFRKQINTKINKLTQPTNNPPQLQ